MSYNRPIFQFLWDSKVINPNEKVVVGKKYVLFISGGDFQQMVCNCIQTPFVRFE